MLASHVHAHIDTPLQQPSPQHCWMLAIFNSEFLLLIQTPDRAAYALTLLSSISCSVQSMVVRTWTCLDLKFRRFGIGV